tara:strand:- start:155 stop:382 length:228 start_codon:yes stop_codon:yes gene_type:complete
MELLIKLTSQELELLIEIMERSRVDSDPENKLRSDLKLIRSQAEQTKQQELERRKSMPNEEVRKMPNPTSSEHVK